MEQETRLVGWWSILLKITLVGVNVFMLAAVGWGSWITSETYRNQVFRQKGDRITPVDMAHLEARLIEKMALLPPPDWRIRIQKLERDLEAIHKTQVRMVLIVERLEKK